MAPCVPFRDVDVQECLLDCPLITWSVWEIRKSILGGLVSGVVLEFWSWGTQYSCLIHWIVNTSPLRKKECKKRVPDSPHEISLQSAKNIVNAKISLESANLIPTIISGESKCSCRDAAGLKS